MKLKLGIIGKSQGNGHPYSWSAIFNGYNSDLMKLSEYPVISDYLSKQVWPQDQIQEGSVTHIWTQDYVLSQRIAEASKIPFICSSYEEMIGQVDAILLARDDSENHLKYASVFINAGVPIYIDKPIATSVERMNEIYALEKYDWQIFTCSALRYAKEFQLTIEMREKLGDILEIHGVTPKSWEKYAIHIIDPICKMVSEKDEILKSSLASDLRVIWKSGLVTSFRATGDEPSSINIKIIGSKDALTLTFKDSFNAFKSALFEFCMGVINKKRSIDKANTLRVVQIIELGMK